jgi:hypothetical protein
MTTASVLPARFQWWLFDGDEHRWSREHATEGDCPGCCCGGPTVCSSCGAREHQEPGEPIAATDVVHVRFCQQEREDQVGDEPTIREVTP